MNMSFAPWEPGFRPENDDPYGDGPFLEFDGQKNRVVPTKRGSWSTKKNVELAYNNIISHARKLTSI